MYNIPSDPAPRVLIYLLQALEAARDHMTSPTTVGPFVPVALTADELGADMAWTPHHPYPWPPPAPVAAAHHLHDETDPTRRPMPPPTIYTTPIAVYPRLNDAPSIRRPARPPVPRAHRAVHPGSPLPRFPTATPPQLSIPRPPGFARPPHGPHPRRRHTRPSSRRPRLAMDSSGIRLGLPPHPAMGPRARRICCHASGPRSPGRH